MIDVLIVGAGPAGLSAGIACARCLINHDWPTLCAESFLYSFSRSKNLGRKLLSLFPNQPGHIVRYSLRQLLVAISHRDKLRCRDISYDE